jgi:hypothetical protein
LDVRLLLILGKIGFSRAVFAALRNLKHQFQADVIAYLLVFKTFFYLN